MQRSTVSLITEQLIRERWVTEGAMGHALRGRKPRMLYLNVERARILGVDVRPALMTIAIADPNGRVIAYENMPTAARPEVFVRDLCRRLQTFLRAHPRLACEGIGITVPGGVDRVRERLVSAPNLGWRDIDLKGPVERATGIPVELENAANACAIAEASFGGDRESRDLIVVTVSEGIGTGTAAARRVRSGGGVRTRQSRRTRPGLQLWPPRMLGGLRLELRRDQSLSRATRRSGYEGRREWPRPAHLRSTPAPRAAGRRRSQSGAGADG